MDRFNPKQRRQNQQTTPPNNPTPPGEGWLPPAQWRQVMWYFVLMLGMLWLWQEVFHQARTRTISYSEFKNYLARGEVVNCTVSED